MDDEHINADVVASIVEKILMNIGMTAYTKVSEILTEYNITFTDCYRKPDILNFAIKEVFDNEYLSVVEKIRTEFGKLEDENHNLAKFLQKLSE